MVSGLGNKVCDETVRKLLRKKGYKFLHSTKIGLLKPKDLKERLKFSRKIKGIFKKNIWTEGRAFFLDGVGYQHKYNPFDEAKSVKSMTCRQRNEGLDPLCTAKGIHTGSGWSGEMFAYFIHKHFKEAFQKSNNPKDKLFLQDVDPSQSSRKANNVMYKVGAKKFSIPAWSPDMNPTENVFNYVRTKLHEESLNANITFENFEEYSARVKKSFLPVSVKYISKAIESMNID